MRIQVLLISHGQLAQEFLNTISLLLHRPVEAKALCLSQNHDEDQVSKAIHQEVGSLAPGDYLLILTDLFGGTPSNLTLPFLKEDRIEVITGLNLAMLVHLFSQKDDLSFEELCEGVKKAGQESIIRAGSFLV